MKGRALTLLGFTAFVFAAGCRPPMSEGPILERPGVGRFSFLTAYARPSAANYLPTADTFRRAAEWRRVAFQSPSEANLRRLGLAHASVASYRNAIDVLEGLDHRRDAVASSDLAAAYLGSAAATSDALSLFRALDRAESAIQLDPNSRVGLFNAAVAQSSLGLHRRGQRSWTRFLELEVDPNWRREAAERLAALETQATVSWNEGEPLTPSNAYHGRRWLATQLRQVSSSRLIVNQMAPVAEEWAKATGDRMWAMVVTELQTRPEVASAYRAFGAALDAAQADDLVKRRESVAIACPELARIQSRLEPLCVLERGLTEYLSLDYPKARASFDQAYSMAESHGYRYVQARASSATGTLQMAVGRFDDAAASLRGAIRVLSSIGEWPDVAGLQTQLADLLNLIGRQGEAWDLRAEAFRHAAAIAEPETDRRIFASASVYSLNSGMPFAARAFAQMPDESHALPELVEAAKLQRQLRAETAIGDLGSARALLDQVRKLLARSSDPRALTMAADVDVGEGLLLAAEGREAEAVERMLHGIASMGVIRQRQKTDALVWVSRIESRLGRFADAKSHLIEAASRVAERPGRLLGGDSILDERGWIWDGLSELSIASLGVDTSVMSILEGTKNAWAEDVSDIEKVGSGANEGLLYFVATGTHLGAWFKRSGEFVFKSLPITPDQLSAQLVDLRERYRSDDSRGVSDTLQRLRRAVLGPFENYLTGLQFVHIVPDGALFSVPFAALLNGDTGRYLVQDVELSFSQRLSTKVTRGASSEPSTGNILLVGEPLAAAVVALPGAREEVRAIATMYDPSRTVTLNGAAATEAAVRRELPSAAVLHFAGHSVARPEAPGRSHLLLSAGTGGEDDDGLMSVREIRHDVVFRKGLLVVLASCATAASQPDRRFGVAHLAAELIAAGASGVFATVDEIPDSSSALFVKLHWYLAKGWRPAAALRQSQIDLLQESQSVALSRWALVQYYTPPSVTGDPSS